MFYGEQGVFASFKGRDEEAGYAGRNMGRVESVVRQVREKTRLRSVIYERQHNKTTAN